MISRSLCYAALAVAGVGLLALAPGMQNASHWASTGEFFHLAQARLSFALLRDQLHTTWLFLWVFAGLWSIVSIWVVVERRRLGMSLGEPAMHWFGISAGVVAVAALLYGVLSNGPLSHQIPGATPVADIAFLVFAFSLPAFAAQRIQSERERAEDEFEGDFREPLPAPGHGLLGLSGLGSEEQGRESRKVIAAYQGERVVLYEVPPPDEATVEAMNRLIETAEKPVPASLQPVVAEPVSTPARPSASGSFREFLRQLNDSWAGIERSGEEIEAWFEQHKANALTRLETPPGARQPGPLLPTASFLEERLDKVDAEWDKLREVVQDLARWFEQGPRLGA
ncbi:hypothetical protein [Silvibacterium sp.]|uniref:hypothetical protein n=1 Tax=Silvibacterium sp. TaxID=1964179 RepID=UPI0039E4355B